MNRDELVTEALRVAAGFPAVTQGQPFGEGAEVFKVGGRVFAIVDTAPDAVASAPAEAAAAASGAVMWPSRAVVTLKCAPPHARALVAEHASIIPGYHMNKEHWISLCPGDDFTETEVEDLVGNSYDIVVSLLPRAKRPSA